MSQAPGPESAQIIAGVYMTRSSALGRAVRAEADPAGARRWHELAKHLVRAHGADAGSLIGHGATLPQLSFAHADTHVALSYIGAAAPDGHAHPGPLDPGDSLPRLDHYFPFRPSHGTRKAGRASLWFPEPSHTGLPHTAMHPQSNAEKADWAAGRVTCRLAFPSKKDEGQWVYQAGHLGVTGTRVEWIRASADRASGAWARRERAAAVGRAGSSFPGQVHAELSGALASLDAGPETPGPFALKPRAEAVTRPAAQGRELKEAPATSQAIRGGGTR